MEPLVFAIVAMRTLYNQKKPFVPESAHFRPFDLRALKRLCKTDADSWSRSASRRGPLVPQIAS
jgi:hypothetical protein